MEKKSLKFRIIITFLIVLFFFKIPLSANTVKVGYFEYEGFNEKAEDGRLSGYGYEFLQYLSRYNNWVYEYLDYEQTWNSTYQNFLEGKYDILCSLRKTKEREELFDFSSIPMGTKSYILSSLNNSSYYINDFENFSGIKVGVLRGNSSNALFEEYAREKGFTFEEVEYDLSDEDLYKVLLRGEVDAILTSNLVKFEDTKPLLEFGEHPIYIAVRKGNQELLDELNQSMEKLKIDYPFLGNYLYTKYYIKENKTNIINLTKDEYNYINNLNKKFRIGVQINNRPFCWVEDGEFKGLLIDFTTIVSEATGIEFEFVSNDSNNLYDIKDSVDCILGVIDESYINEKNGFKIANSKINIHLSKLYYKQVDNEVIGLIKSQNSIFDYIYHQFGENQKYKYYDSIEEAIFNLEIGEIDSIYTNYFLGQIIINENNLPNLSIIADLSSIGYTIAIKNDISPYFISIIDKAFQNLIYYNLDGIIKEYIVTNMKKVSFSVFWNQNKKTIILAFLFLLVGILIIFNLSSNYVKKIEESNKKLIKATNAKSDFLSKMSHDIRTPLSAIIGLSKLAIESEVEKETFDYLDKISISSKYLLGLINDILDMSAIEENKIIISNLEFSLKDLILSISSIYYQRCKEKHIEFSVYVENLFDEVVIGDRLRLQQILNNLLSNSYKFTEEKGSIKLFVIGKIIRNNKVEVVFKVVDTGIGMSKDTLKNLYKPFIQASSVTASKYGGSGLGMTIVKSLVTLMDGSIDVTSQLGKGSSISVNLHFDSKKREKIIKSDSKILLLGVEKSVCACFSDYFENNIDSIFCSDNIEINQRLFKKDYYDKIFIDNRIIKKHNSKIWLQINRNKKSNFYILSYDSIEIEDRYVNKENCFFLRLPLFYSDIKAVIEKPSSYFSNKKNINYQIKYDFTNIRILVADDIEINSIIIKKFLEKYNAEVKTVLNGKEVVDIVKKKGNTYFDLILMDLKMPIIDGYEATKIIRNLESEKEHIPIIAFSANAFTRDKEKSLENGMDAFLAKPYDIDKVYSTIDKLLKNSKVK